MRLSRPFLPLRRCLGAWGIDNLSVTTISARLCLSTICAQEGGSAPRPPPDPLGSACRPEYPQRSRHRPSRSRFDTQPREELMSAGGVLVDEPRVPTFQEFASQWFERQTVEGGRAGTGLAPKSREDLAWRLTGHLLPAFASCRLDEISIRDVDGYRVEKVRDGDLGSSSINKTIATLATILEVAVE